MPSIRSARVDAPGGLLTIVETSRPEPGYGQARIPVEARGICRVVLTREPRD
jgi:D-arabinose 1-dehydrogenase-like Zn-dependent alcohol dehydrogenase